MNTAEIFKDRLRAAAGAKECKQAEIARQIRVSRASVSLWFHGTVEPQGKHLRALARYLNVREEWLLGQESNGANSARLDVLDSRLFVDGSGAVNDRALADEIVRRALMDLQKELMDLAAAYLALPQNERDHWRTCILDAAAPYRSGRPTTRAIEKPQRPKNNKPPKRAR